MSNKFIGRKVELEQLNKAYLSGRKELGIIYGRRRIGKSALISEFLKNKKAVFFQAKKDNAYGNLKSFSYTVNKLLGLPKSFVFTNWQEAFDAVIDYAKDERVVLAIDEYPYIVEQDGSFPSVVQEFVDRAGDNFFVLLSGSDVSFLKKEIQSHSSPLYKRRTFEMPIIKLPFTEACEFLSDFDNENKCKYLALFSTYPYYLSAINHSASFEENVKDMLFNQYGMFFSLPDQLLSNSTNVQDVYNAILQAISHRKRTNKEIADYIHEDEAKVAKYLLTLLAGEIVVKCETFKGNRKTNYYEIGDPLLKFWYSFIYQNQERIRINGKMIFNECEEEIHSFICHEFENVSRLFLDQKNSDGELNEVFPPLKNYKVENSKLGRSIEIDGLSETETQLLVVECKFRNIPFDIEMWKHLLESVSVFPNKLHCIFYIFSKSGFTDEVKNLECESIKLFTLNEMFN